ncbi:MAG TPA: response regulator transcription factor [Acidimicrobiales bacterium]|nr:response regulator transcription factor [Acidimicrobiales bacterium]
MSDTTQVRVLLADDHTALREGLRRSLEAAGLTVVGEAADGEQAVSLAVEHQPDIVLMDVSMPKGGGVEATRIIRTRLPDVEVVMLTMHSEPAVVGDAVRAGAAGYLVKDCSTDDIVGMLRTVAAGEAALSPALATSMLEAANPTGPGAEPDPLLTKREEEVLKLIADGASTPEVGKALYISTKTVRHHLSSIYEKLESRDRTQAVLRAVRMGIIRLD